MNVARTAAEVLSEHVVLEYEAIDRMYLNAYVPHLQSVGGVVGFLHQRGFRFASTAALAPMTTAFVKSVDRFACASQVDVVTFAKGQRKDDLTKQYLAGFSGTEGVLYVGKAQEKARVMRTERRKAGNGGTYPWIVPGSAMVNHYYFYCVDEDFGPFFLKYCSYFPYNAKLCINGHEYAKCQLRKRAIEHTPLDNGLYRCADPVALQRIADELDEAKIQALFAKWHQRLPHPYPIADQQAGCRYELSILQAEFALTQVLDRPAQGRVLFEDLIRENLDLGRPSQVQLIFDRRITRRTPGRFRTRVITQGVTPSLHVDYKHTRIKQYHKEGQALRTETTINDTYDFAIGKRLHNLAALRQVGFNANRRLLRVQTISRDCALSDDQFQRHQKPLELKGQRAPALRFAEPRVQALMHLLVLFVLYPCGFRNREVREQFCSLLGVDPNQWSPGKITYDLRRLRLHGLIHRPPGSYCYQVTEEGLRTAMFYTRVYTRILRPGLADLSTGTAHPLSRAFTTLNKAINQYCDQAKLAA